MSDPSPSDALLSLEAELPAALAATLFRHPAIARQRLGRTRSSAASLSWFDTAKGALAEQGLALEAADTAHAPRRLVQSLPPAEAHWCPASPAAELEKLPPDAAPRQAGGAPLHQVGGFRGRRLILKLRDGIEAVLLHGVLHGQAETAAGVEQPVARLTLTGPPGAVLALLRELSGTLPLLPPATSLAEAARALALGDAPRPRRLGAPRLDDALSVEAALLRLLGHLTEVLIWFAPLAAAGNDPTGNDPTGNDPTGNDPTGVHQMRVALRRLRSALAAFRGAAKAPELRRFDGALKDLARGLGPARDWDVFLGGLGAELAEALPGEPRIAALLAAGRRHREDAYAALRQTLDGPDFRLMLWNAVALEATCPWRQAPDAEAAERRDQALPHFASHLLARRWRRLVEVGEDITHLPDAEFHALRLDGKRMRYLAELFAPLFGRKRGRRFLERLAAMQEQFGLANDASVARALVEREAHGPEAWAAGVAEGWVLARTRRARGRAEKAWSELLKAECFWNQG